MVPRSCELCSSLGSHPDTKLTTLDEQRTHSQIHGRQWSNYISEDESDRMTLEQIFVKCFTSEDVEKPKELEKSRSKLMAVCKDIIQSKKNDTNTIECQECGSLVRYMNECVILCHACTHSSKKPFVCRECKLELPTKIRMVRHIKQIHKIASPLSGEHFDGSWTDCFDELKESLMKCFGGSNLGPVSSSKIRTLQRQSVFKNIMKSANKATKIKCAQCQKEIRANRARLEEHISTHLHRPIFECSMCDVSLNHRCNITTHLKKHHGVSSKRNYVDRSGDHHEEILDWVKKCFGKGMAK